MCISSITSKTVDDFIFSCKNELNINDIIINAYLREH